MKANANADLVDFFLAFPILDQHSLHAGCGFHGPDGVIELGENGIADCFDDAAAFGFDHRKQDAVMTIDHLHVCEIALFFGICRRALDVAEENRHRRAQLLEFLLRLRPRFQ